MIIGTEVIDPGITFVFEAAPKDTIYPETNHLSEAETDLHIEMLANWSFTNSVKAPVDGFVAYLNVLVEITNKNGESNKFKLSPHLNLIDNLHYARNIKLPGSINDLYDLTFTITPPDEEIFGVHYDWFHQYGDLIEAKRFEYKDLNFKKIASMERR